MAEFAEVQAAEMARVANGNHDNRWKIWFNCNVFQTLTVWTTLSFFDTYPNSDKIQDVRTFADHDEATSAGRLYLIRKDMQRDQLYGGWFNLLPGFIPEAWAGAWTTDEPHRAKITHRACSAWWWIAAVLLMCIPRTVYVLSETTIHMCHFWVAALMAIRSYRVFDRFSTYMAPNVVKGIWLPHFNFIHCFGGDAGFNTITTSFDVYMRWTHPISVASVGFLDKWLRGHLKDITLYLMHDRIMRFLQAGFALNMAAVLMIAAACQTQGWIVLAHLELLAWFLGYCRWELIPMSHVRHSIVEARCILLVLCAIDTIKAETCWLAWPRLFYPPYTTRWNRMMKEVDEYIYIRNLAGVAILLTWMATSSTGRG